MNTLFEKLAHRYQDPTHLIKEAEKSGEQHAEEVIRKEAEETKPSFDAQDGIHDKIASMIDSIEEVTARDKLAADDGDGTPAKDTSGSDSEDDATVKLAELVAVDQALSEKTASETDNVTGFGDAYDRMNFDDAAEAPLDIEKVAGRNFVPVMIGTGLGIMGGGGAAFAYGQNREKKMKDAFSNYVHQDELQDRKNIMRAYQYGRTYAAGTGGQGGTNG